MRLGVLEDGVCAYVHTEHVCVCVCDPWYLRVWGPKLAED